MSRRFTSFARVARAATALLLLASGAALPGCFTVDDEPECSKDSDCDDGEFCTEDDECESTCRAVCRSLIRCGGSTLDQDTCEGSCEYLRDDVSGADCVHSLADLATCFDENSS